MKKQLTAKQYSILVFLREFSTEHQRPPTHREIGARFGIVSTNGIADHLHKLERKGWIERDRGLARGIRFVP